MTETVPALTTPISLSTYHQLSLTGNNFIYNINSILWGSNNIYPI